MRKFRHITRLLWAICTIAVVCACSSRKSGEEGNAIYYWRTTFKLDSSETEFIRQHDIKRIYLRMFDVASEHDFDSGGKAIVPIATTVFADSVPDDIEIVPTTFITVEALREMQGKENEYAIMIVKRLLAMASYNNCGPTREIQLDCDWTTKTKDIFNRLCCAVKEQLLEDSVKLSVTVRLHQLRQEAPAADRGVLMVYNTGKLKDPKAKNSILDFDDIKPYLSRSVDYPLPLDHAYPLFGWGVLFNDGQFERIVTEPDSIKTNASETLRIERPTAEEVLQVKRLVESQLGKPSRGNIIYHLDNNQLKHHNDNDITKIFANN